MAREILLYNPILPPTAKMFIQEMKESQNENEDLKIRIASPGGRVLDAWGMIYDVANYPGNVDIQVDGYAWSMGTAFLPFARKRTALSSAELMIHKATGPTDNENDRRMLANANKEIKNKLEKTINTELLKEMKGKTLDEIFADEADQEDIGFTAEEARKIGLVDEVIDLDKMTDKEAAKYAPVHAFSLQSDGSRKVISAGPSGSSEFSSKSNQEQKQNTVMTIDELKNNHPGLYEQVKNEGVKEGKKNGAEEEKKRVNGWLQWYEADSKRVMEAIKNGEELDMSEASALMKKHNDKQLQNLAEKESPENATPQNGAENKGKGPEGGGEQTPDWLPPEFKEAVKQEEWGSQKSGPSAEGSKENEGASGEGEGSSSEEGSGENK